MSSEEVFINGELLRLSRESRGWLLNDMATRACMSAKQIRQIEEGGLSSFYSMAVKVTAAKKVGALLGLTPDKVLVQTTAEELPVEMAEPLVATELPVDAAPLVVQEALYTEVESEVPSAELASPSAVTEDAKSKTSLWVIAGLFGMALAVAAYMQPQEEEAAEPAPPLQVIPAENVDPASAASSADSTASAAEAALVSASAAQMTAKPASSAASKAP
jgi:transcriptional regulator with XRE-family HTH domain